MRYCDGIARLLCVAIILLSASSMPLFARGQGTLMGQMQAVVENGPSDAGRNPALLALLGQGSCGSVFVIGRAYEHTDVSADNPTFEADFDFPVSGDVIVSYAAGIGRAVAGIEVSDNGTESMFVKRSYAMGFTLDGAVARQDTDVDSWNPAIRCAIAFPLSGTDFIGFQASLGYSQIMTDSTLSMSSGSLSLRVGQQSTDRVMLASAVAGYLHAEGDSQIGLMVSSGEIRRQWTDLSVDEEVVSAGTQRSGSFSVNNCAKYVSGPGFLAGASRKINPLLAAAFECGYIVPAGYSLHEFKYSYSSALIAEKQTVRVGDNGTYVFRGGLALYAGRGFVISTGLMYVDVTRTRYEHGISSDEGEKRKTEKVSMLLGAVGFDYSPGDRVTFTLGAFIVQSRADSDENGSDSSISTEATVLALDVAAGITWRF